MKPHATDPLALTFGLLFLGIAVLWLVGRFATLTVAGVAWAVTLGLVALGGLGIASALRSGRRHRPDQPGD